MKRKTHSIKFILNIISAIFGLIGAFIIVGNKIELIDGMMENTNKWKNITLAINRIDSLNNINPDRDNERIGFVNSLNVGFNELLKIIYVNMPELKDSNIVIIVKSQPLVVGGIAARVINIVYEKELNYEKIHYNPITTEYEFYRWIRDYKEKSFLNIGMILIGLGYIFSLISSILGCCNNKHKTKFIKKRRLITRKHLNNIT